MKVSNIKCELKHSISTMVICGSYMHEFSFSKDIREKINNDKRRKEVAVGEGGGAFMSNTNYQRTKKQC
jgi:hypothetical protein